MKKIYQIIIFLFSLLSLGCTSKISNEADTLEVKTEIIVDQDSDSNNGIDNDGIIDSKEESDISIDKDIIDPDDKDMLQDMIVVAINEAINLVINEEQKILAKQQASMRLPF